MSIELKCSVKDLQRSYVPNVYIAEMSCGNVHVKMDIHEEVRVFDQGDTVMFTLSKELPEFHEGRDFVATGYVVSFKEAEKEKKMIVSLWGFTVIVEGPEKLFKEFAPMDKVYLRISKEGG